MTTPHPNNATDAEQGFERLPQESSRTINVMLDGVNLKFCLTQKSLREFEDQGLFAMDEYLANLSARMTPSNTPHSDSAPNPTPLNLLGQILLDGFADNNSRKVMLCLLWLGHHYPSINGFNKIDNKFNFNWNDRPLTLKPFHSPHL
ncbi:MAG: hypothetical protein OQK24_08935 [Magnetovibrio sp.]|nr:hypothetical protein [Magnetovibrio sp.]